MLQYLANYTLPRIGNVVELFGILSAILSKCSSKERRTIIPIDIFSAGGQKNIERSNTAKKHEMGFRVGWKRNISNLTEKEIVICFKTLIFVTVLQFKYTQMYLTDNDIYILRQNTDNCIVRDYVDMIYGFHTYLKSY